MAAGVEADVPLVLDRLVGNDLHPSDLGDGWNRSGLAVRQDLLQHSLRQQRHPLRPEEGSQSHEVDWSAASTTASMRLPSAVPTPTTLAKVRSLTPSACAVALAVKASGCSWSW